MWVYRVMAFEARKPAILNPGTDCRVEFDRIITEASAL